MFSSPSTMLRGMCKVIAIAFVTSQVLTTAFMYGAKQLDAEVPHDTVWLFGCITCGLVSLWLQSDARRAFGFAREHGFVKVTGDGQRTLQIAADCPRRWLVILHAELNPAAIRA